MPHRIVWAALLIAILALGAAGYVMVAGSVAADRVTIAEERAQSLGEQVADACAKGGAAAAELGPHACSQAVEVQQLPGPAGERGPAGPQGDKGDPGADGQNPPCLADPPHCQGAAGQDGTPGVNGVDGQPGRDGADGAPGQDGQDGEDGKPPAGWTWVDGDGREQSCTRDNTDDSAPHYACTAEPPRNTLPIPIPGG